MATLNLVTSLLTALLAAVTGSDSVAYDSSAGATAVNPKATSATVFGLRIDNSANAAATYVKLYNNAAPTVGTTAPDEVIFVGANQKLTVNYGTGGKVFGTALSYAAVTTGGTAGTTSPTSAVPLALAYT